MGHQSSSCACKRGAYCAPTLRVCMYSTETARTRTLAYHSSSHGLQAAAQSMDRSSSTRHLASLCSRAFMPASVCVPFLPYLCCYACVQSFCYASCACRQSAARWTKPHVQVAAQKGSGPHWMCASLPASMLCLPPGAAAFARPPVLPRFCLHAHSIALWHCHFAGTVYPVCPYRQTRRESGPLLGMGS